MKKLLVTGASGFIGHALACSSRQAGYDLRRVIHKTQICLEGDNWDDVVVSGINSETDWSIALDKVDFVVHLAARVHVMKDRLSNPLAEFREVNTKGTINLATQAARYGVKRFIFISSIKVNGEGSNIGQYYTPDDLPSPVDPYGISKYEAECQLFRLGQETGMEIIVIRPVLVYGPGVKANFLSMMNLLNKGLPLPFGKVENRRSLVALDNLTDLIITCIEHPAAANQVFLVSDDEDLSTTALLRRMGEALGKPARLIPINAGILKAGAMFLGRRDIAQRLLGSLQVDISKTKSILGWSPPISVEEALGKTAQDFLFAFRECEYVDKEG